MSRSANLQFFKDTVQASMKLRAPQLESLDAFHSIYRDLPDRLPFVSREALLELFRQRRSHWRYDADFPEMAFSLATGVGKTRLIGAIIAYLYLSRESANFVVLAHRTTIVQKIIRECNISSPKYIFADPHLVPEPRIITADNLDNFERPMLNSSGPTIWVISPQAIARTRDAESLRFHRRGEYQTQSPSQFLRSLDDLVMFFDEGHHLDKGSSGKDAAWTRAVRDLNPRMLFEMTASPRDEANILYEYTIKDCLREGLYTKGVQVLVQPRTPGMTDEDWDRRTLRVAVDRLNVKQAAMAEEAPESPPAVLLVGASSIDHANAVAEVLKGMVGKDEVLVIHSDTNREESQKRLLQIELPSSKTRVVVSVMMLNEGWDVSNVFVIAPLRAMATLTGVVQTMGRGLRLPFGKRIGNYELDTLDVLCFGRENFHQIIDQVLAQGFGRREDGEQFIEVKRSQDEERKLKRFRMDTVMEPDPPLVLPKMSLDIPEINLETLRVPARETSSLSAIDLHDPETRRKLKMGVGFDWEEFLELATSIVLRNTRQLGGITAQAGVSAAVERCLLDSGFVPDKTVRLEPEVVGNLVSQAARNLIATTKPTYTLLPSSSSLPLEPLEVLVPEDFERPIPHWKVKPSRGAFEFKGIPLGAWKRCLYESVPFDTAGEVQVAKVLDSTEEISWWIRNLGKVFRLDTPVGGYAPDFLFLVRLPNRNVLLEVKDERLAYNPYGDVAVKANAAEIWCSAATEATGHVWEYWMVLDRDARGAQYLSDLESAAEDWRLLVPNGG